MSDHLRRREEGFTVVEVLVAIVNLGIVLLGINAVLLTGFTQAAVSKSTSDAAAVAQQQLETLRDVSYANIQAAPTTTVTVGTYAYTVNRTVTVNDPVPNIKHIKVTVTWNLQGTRSYVAETYFSDAGR
jgi:type II secretory pathway pseudopilin PulG